MPRNPRNTMSSHFFRRDPDDGGVRLRLRFTAEEAALIEEAAGKTPLLLYIHRVLNERARFHISRQQAGLPALDQDDLFEEFDDDEDEGDIAHA